MGANSLESTMRKFENIINEINETGIVYDSHSLFPDAFFDKIAANQLHTLTMGSEFGGQSFGLAEISQVIFELATACPSTALCAAMHYYTLGVLDKVMSNELKAQVFKDIQENGHFTTSFNQPNFNLLVKGLHAHDSISIMIAKEKNHFVVNGISPIVSGVTRFKYLPIFGFQKDTNTRFGITALMISKDDLGVTIKNAWKMAGMRSTLSHSVQFENVHVPMDRLIGREGHAIEDTFHTVYWSRATISAVYLGIAYSAIDHIKEVLKTKIDRISGRKSVYLPGNQFDVADMLIKYETAFHQLFSFAKMVDQNNKNKDSIIQSSIITKCYIDDAANSIVTTAMNMAGSASLKEGSKLEKLYRDVKAASFHQPASHLAKEILSKKFLGVLPGKTRWL